MSWLPNGYEVPKSQGNYMKLEDGKNKFRVLSAPLLGYVYWNTERKPVRSEEMPENPADIRLDGDGNPEPIKHFWAFVVWNYAAEKVQILEITQATIQRGIMSAVQNEDYGSPEGYDITVERTGKELKTEYTVMPSPPKRAPEVVEEAKATMKVNLKALLTGADPFAA